VKTSNSRLAEITSLFERAEKLLVVGHIAPDGDSLGSTMALARLLAQSGKEAHVACLDRIPARYEFLLRYYPVITHVDELPLAADCIVILDCGDLARTGLPAHYVAERQVINIDHHVSNRGTWGLSWVDDAYSATGQQIMSLVDHAAWQVDSGTATCLYASLTADTGFFRHTNTTPELFRDAARLLEWGADARLVTEQALERRSLGELCLLRHALTTLSLHGAEKVAMIEVSYEVAERCGIQADEVEDMVDFARAVPEVEVAILLKGMSPQVTKVSLRAKGRVDVSKVAETFGGGGHRAAAGATLPYGLAVARQEVLQRVMQVLKSD